MAEPVIALKNVSYRYPHAAAAMPAALSEVSLDIWAGEFVALVGANGSGKSTLARLLNGLLLPDAGEVLADGLATSDAVSIDHIRETVGMVFQNPGSQIVATSVEDDIAFGLENLGVPVAEIEARVADAARRFSVEHLLKREPHWLSGGQQQRTVLAGVVALGPRVLVLDEPTSMLDPRSQKQFLHLVEELWQEGTTVIYITQNMEEAVWAPRLVALSGGRVAFDGPPADFFYDSALLARTGMRPPLAVRLAAALRQQGVRLPSSLTLSELVTAVCACN
ncbi:MAG: ATP-binding cassette domain-containing protein [Thermoleophilia bacterium]